jgi:phage FluMu protein gp41
MTTDKMRRIHSRLEKLGKLFPAKPVVTPEQAISVAAVQQMSGEDLMVLRRMIKAGRPLLASNERESEAVAAYRSAVVAAITPYRRQFEAVNLIEGGLSPRTLR